MPWRRSTLDPTNDPVAPAVIAAFDAAERAGLAIIETQSREADQSMVLPAD